MNTTAAGCGQPDCTAPLVARGRCRKHYMRWRRTHLNEVASPDDDPRMGWCKRLSELLSEAPDGMLSASEQDLITSMTFTAAASARGALPITPLIRAQMLHAAVDAITVEALAG